MNIDFQDKIDDFVLDKMSKTDINNFSKEIDSDKEKQEQLQLTKDLCNAIKSRNAKMTLISQFHKEYNDEHEDDYKKKKVIFWMSSIIGVAAVFIMGIFIVIPPMKDFTRLSSNSNLANLEQTVPVDFNLYQESNKSFNDIVELLKQTKYEDALKLINLSEEHIVNECNKLSAKSENTSSINLDGFKVNETNVFSNMSDSIINNERVTNNIKLLEKQKYELAWFKVNTLIGLNRILEAKQILKELHVVDGVYKFKADSLLNIIEKRYKE